MAFIENLPDTFYRVSVKALVFDEQHRLLVFKSDDGEWEVPGGGWEQAESLEDCLARELQEEVQAEVASVGDIAFCYRGQNASGNPKLSLAVYVTLRDDRHFVPTGDDIAEARFVTREEFLSLPFQKSEETIKTCVDQIWGSAKSPSDRS